MTDHHDEPSHGDNTHAGMGMYVVVFLALIALTIASYVLGGAFSSAAVTNPAAKSIGWAIMIVISCVKAGLVMAIFMHLFWEANWKYVLTVPCVIMSTLLLLALTPDIGWRSDNYSEDRIRHAPELTSSEHPGHAAHGDGDTEQGQPEEGQPEEGQPEEGQPEETDGHGS